MKKKKTIRVERSELKKILRENEQLRDKVTELQQRNTQLIEERRACDRRYQVSQFHRAFDQPVLKSPSTEIGSNYLNLRLSLVFEEVFEMAEACGMSPSDLERASQLIETAITEKPKTPIDLVDLCDALGDIDYVVEGFRLAVGVDGVPIANIIHETNMAKVGGPLGPNGKKLKPPGWVGPEKAIAEELIRQGWDE